MDQIDRANMIVFAVFLVMLILEVYFAYTVYRQRNTLRNKSFRPFLFAWIGMGTCVHWATYFIGFDVLSSINNPNFNYSQIRMLEVVLLSLSLAIVEVWSLTRIR